GRRPVAGDDGAAGRVGERRRARSEHPRLRAGDRVDGTEGGRPGRSVADVQGRVLRRARGRRLRSRMVRLLGAEGDAGRGLARLRADVRRPPAQRGGRSRHGRERRRSRATGRRVSGTPPRDPQALSPRLLRLGTLVRTAYWLLVTATDLLSLI